MRPKNIIPINGDKCAPEALYVTAERCVDAMDFIRRFISARTDHVILGERESNLENGPGIHNQTTTGVFGKSVHTRYTTFKQQWFRQKGDICCFVFGIIVVVYLIGGSLPSSVYKNSDTIDLDTLGRLLHARHDDDNDDKDDAQTMADMLSISSFETPQDLPAFYNSKCRKITDQELIRGKTFQGTSLPFLLQVMCQVLHRDAGCQGSSRGIIPRVVNATLLAHEFFRTTGRDIKMINYFNTQNQRVSNEIETFSDLHFFSTETVGSRMRHVSYDTGQMEMPEHMTQYILEDLCLITYKDARGLCYHYFNPELKSLSPEGYTRPNAYDNVGDANKGNFFADTLTGIVDSVDTMMQQGYAQPETPRSKVTMLTIKSQIFSFLGRHIFKLFVPVIFQYQPIIEKDYEYTLQLDKLDPSSDATDEETVRVILNYKRDIATKLLSPMEDDLWMRSSPATATFGLSSSTRAYQLAMMADILQGVYLSPEYFVVQSEGGKNE